MVLGRPSHVPLPPGQGFPIRNLLAAPTPGKRYSTLVQDAVQRLQDGRVAVQVEEALPVMSDHGSQSNDAPARGELAREVAFARWELRVIKGITSPPT